MTNRRLSEWSQCFTIQAKRFAGGFVPIYAVLQAKNSARIRPLTKNGGRKIKTPSRLAHKTLATIADRSWHCDAVLGVGGLPGCNYARVTPHGKGRSRT